MLLPLTLLALLLAPARAADPRWNLAWSDEFNGRTGERPDPARWTYDVGDNGWGNEELEDYCAAGSALPPCDPARPNAYQDGRGRLVIEAVKSSSGTWTSARLKTLGLAHFQYGRIEAKIKLPTGPGLWPAFWLLGVDISSVGWPASGEIDIMENVPGDVPGGLGVDTIKATLHGPGYWGVHGCGLTTKLPGGGRVDDGFHVYGASWSPNQVDFYVDHADKPFFHASRAGIPKDGTWVFDKPFYLIMNLAVGGSWPKSPNEKTPNPARMLVDYVRVYRPAPAAPALSKTDAAFLDDLARRNLRYFVERAEPKTGLVLDRAPADGSGPPSNVASVASTGFGLAGLCVGAERGWLPRAKAEAQAKKTLRFLFNNAPQERGWLYHFIDATTGARAWNSEASSIDTALLLAGALTARRCFTDAEIDRLATGLYERVDFPWMLNGSTGALSMGWTPEKGFIAARWDTYSEHMVLDLLAVGSPTQPIPAAVWDAWARPKRSVLGYEYVSGVPPLFIHQYTQAFVDLRGRRDVHGLDYFDNSIKATLAQRAFLKKAGYGEGLWGLTSSDKCGASYVAWGAPPLDPEADGSVVPSAPGGSLMFTPKESLAVLEEMRRRFPKAYGRYGFADSFNPKTGCVTKDVLGIDQGITLLSAANLLGGDVWNYFMRNAEIVAAMQKVGFNAPTGRTP